MTDEIHDIEVEVENTETPQDRNFRLLREQKEALEAEVRELRQLRTRELLREAGFDPASAQGKAISYALAAKGGDAPKDADGIRQLVETEFPEWKPGAQLTSDEMLRNAQQQRVEALRVHSQGDEPPDIDAQIAEAEAAGNWFRSGQLKLQKMAGGG